MIKVLGFLVVILSVWFGLSGCAHQPKTLAVSCFADGDAAKARQPKEAEGPLIIDGGQVLYYDADGSLHRMKDATCGIR